MNHIFCINSSVEGHLCCFQLLAITNKAAMNIGKGEEKRKGRIRYEEKQEGCPEDQENESKCAAAGVRRQGKTSRYCQRPGMDSMGMTLAEMPNTGEMESEETTSS